VVELGARIVGYAEAWDIDPARLSGFAMVHPVRLNVDSDNPTGAVSLYRRVGMRVVTAYDLWPLPIPSRHGGEPGSG
jgi:hypothetical protein